MKDTNLKNKEKKGVALIISVGVLALIAMIATSFAINMQIEYRGALNYLNAAKAEAVAQAGINKAIADIRTWAATSEYNTVMSNIATNYPSPNNTEVQLSDGAYYTVAVEREDQKVNINALDEADSVWIDRLYSTGQATGLTYDDIAKIIDYKDPDSNPTTELMTSAGRQVASGDETNAKNAPYATVEELRLALKDDAKYNAIKDIVTVSAPIIRGGLIGKYYGTNKAGFDKDTILSLSNFKGKVIELGEIRETGVPSADNWYENHDAEFAGAYLVNDLQNFVVDHFGVRWEGYIDILPSQVGIPIYFWTRSDDGNRLYIDGERIIDSWRDQGMWDPLASKSGTRTFNIAGWHQIKVEYYENEGENSIWLKWDTQDHPNDDWINNFSIPFVPAGCLGYYPPSWTDYNSGGYYKITSTGRIKSDAGKLAEKKTTAIIKIFGTWTQTTRAEFHSAWYHTYNRNETGDYLDCSTGRVNCVTFLDSCPTDSGDNWDSAGYHKISDSLKLGFWDNLDEDVGYSETMLVDVLNVDMSNFGVPIGSGNKLKVWAAAYSNREIEINGAYYWLGSSSSYDVFARAWEYDGETPDARLEPPYCTAWLFAKHWSYYGALQRESALDKNYYTILKQEYEPYWTGSPIKGGLDELTLGDWEDGNTVEWEYSQSKTLGIIGSGIDYTAYVNDVGAITRNYGSASIPGSVCLMSCNAYEFTKDEKEWSVEPPSDDPKIDSFVTAKGGTWTRRLKSEGPPETYEWYFDGGTSILETYWDNIRVIPAGGWFISTPCYAGEEVEWGTLSWTGETPGQTAISLYARAADTQLDLGLGDTGWSKVDSSGSQIPLVKNKWIQYKAVLSTNVSSYQPDTPALEDVTVTYLPTVEVLYLQK